MGHALSVLCDKMIAQLTKGGVSMKEDVEAILARHEQQLHTLERDMIVLKEVQTESRAMNEKIVKLATELKHTNEHLAKHETKIEHMSKSPHERLQQAVTAAIVAVASRYPISLAGAQLVPRRKHGFRAPRRCTKEKEIACAVSCSSIISIVI